jgi:hypothetical protein
MLKEATWLKRAPLARIEERIVLQHGRKRMKSSRSVGTQGARAVRDAAIESVEAFVGQAEARRGDVVQLLHDYDQDAGRHARERGGLIAAVDCPVAAPKVRVSGGFSEQRGGWAGGTYAVRPKRTESAGWRRLFIMLRISFGRYSMSEVVVRDSLWHLACESERSVRERFREAEHTGSLSRWS